MSDGLATLLAALVGAVAAIAGGWLAHAWQLRRTKAEWRNQNEQWIRQQRFEAYKQALYYAFKLEMSSGVASGPDKDVRQHVSESQRWIALLEALEPIPANRSALRDMNARLQRAARGSHMDLPSAAAEVHKRLDDMLRSSMGSQSELAERNQGDAPAV